MANGAPAALPLNAQLANRSGRQVCRLRGLRPRLGHLSRSLRPKVMGTMPVEGFQQGNKGLVQDTVNT